ncbi:MAG: hypothetical protein H8F28_26935 [Fibrella sp.]|nr:hypothetical protein [Armatimonadota bacterium]
MLALTDEIRERLYQTLSCKESKALSDERLEEIIAWLISIRSRPQVFFETCTPESVLNSLYWFRNGFTLCGYKYAQYHYHVWEKHGCDPNRPVLDLRERGISEEIIVQEILDVEIEAWGHCLQKHMQSATSYRKCK